MLLALAFSDLNILLNGFDSAFFESAFGLFVLALLPCFGLAIVARLANCTADGETQKRLSFWGRLLCVVGFSLSMLAMMVPAVMRARHATAEQTWVPKTFGGEMFQVSVPASWETGRAVEPGPGILYLTAAHHDLHMMAWAAAKVDMTLPSLPELRDLAIGQLADTLTDPDVTPFEMETVGTGHALDTVATGSIGGTRLWYIVRHLDYGAYWVEVRVWTTPSRLEEHQDVLERIVDSVAPVR